MAAFGVDRFVDCGGSDSFVAFRLSLAVFWV